MESENDSRGDVFGGETLRAREGGSGALFGKVDEVGEVKMWERAEEHEGKRVRVLEWFGEILWIWQNTTGIAARMFRILRRLR